VPGAAQPGATASSRSTGPAATPPPVSAGTGRRGAAPPETPIEYKDVRVLAITGRRSSDQQGVLSFSAGNITMLGRGTNAALASMPYDALLRATYVRGRDPKWDPSLAAPPQDLDVGGMFRTAKHWLVLQGREAFVVLRLEDNNWRPVLNAVVERTKVQITLESSGEK